MSPSDDSVSRIWLFVSSNFDFQLGIVHRARAVYDWLREFVVNSVYEVWISYRIGLLKTVDGK